MEDILHQWPMLAVTFFSMVEISESLLFIRRVSLRLKGGQAATAFTAFFLLCQVYCVISRFQRTAATVNRSLRATQWAFRVFCLEYFFKLVAVLSYMALTTMNPEFDKENMEKTQAKLANISILTKLMFYTPIMVGWGLKRTLNELRKEDREAIERQQPQQQQQRPSSADPTAMTEEERRQLLRVRAWPRYLVGYATTGVILGNLHFFATFPSDTSRWDMFLVVLMTLLSSFATLANYHMSLPGCRVILKITIAELVFRYLESAWSAFYQMSEEPLTTDLIMANVIPDLVIIWVVKQVIQDLEERDARIEAYNARVTAAIAEKARLQATYEESSRGGSTTFR